MCLGKCLERWFLGRGKGKSVQGEFLRLRCSGVTGAVSVEGMGEECRNKLGSHRRTLGSHLQILSRIVTISGLFSWCQLGERTWKLEDNLGGCQSNLGKSSGFQSWVLAVRKEKNLRESEFHNVLFSWYKIGAE